jgi:antitoxin CcdA
MAEGAPRDTAPDIDPALLREARAAGVDVRGRTEAEIRAAIPRARQWRRENAAAIEALNRRIEEVGLPLEKHRLF